MSHKQHFIAIDLGAESGRVIGGRFDGERIQSEEAHRFANAPVRLPDGLHTDVLHIWTEVKAGMAKVIRQARGEIGGIGVDSWGVDFALLDHAGALLSNPYQYRDSMTDGILEEAFRIVPREEIFEQTGIQIMQINSLYQLLALRRRNSPALEAAASILWTPDLFNYWMTDLRVSESCIASTSQCYDPRQGDWAMPLIKRFDLPTEIFRPLVLPGTVLGDLIPAVAEEVGAGKRIPVITPGGHDTALAVAAVPAQGKDFAYLSSGTWSLMGAELGEPCITAESLDRNFTNEGGVCRTIRFLKNITGLWVLQACRREWAGRGDELSYVDLTKLAGEAAPLRSLIDVEHGDFAKSDNMPSRIQVYCRRTGQPVPETKGEVARCVLESLALTYRKTLIDLERTLKRRLDPLHIVGGGSQNALLNQFAANATGRRVVAGPQEATAIGSILMQAMAAGLINSLAEGREVVRRSFPSTIYEPVDSDVWEEAFQRFIDLKHSD
jgi:rhamnulokinase